MPLISPLMPVPQGITRSLEYKLKQNHRHYSFIWQATETLHLWFSYRIFQNIGRDFFQNLLRCGLYSEVAYMSIFHRDNAVQA